MERRVDYLSFSNGGKMTIPFETFLVFSTNLSPNKLGDEAFLRRIQYKMLLRSPSVEEFRLIFCEFCKSQGIGAPCSLVDAFISKHYVDTGKAFRRCHPRDVISQAIDLINFKRLPHELTDDLLDQAFASCFLSTDELVDTLVCDTRPTVLSGRVGFSRVMKHHSSRAIPIWARSVFRRSAVYGFCKNAVTPRF